MPRIAPALLRRAASASAHLAALLPACRDLSSAVRELGWIREHVAARAARTTRSRDLPERSRRWLEESLTKQLCIRRGSGEPLQYVLGNQPFGGLDVLCRRGVLIPRPETEAYTIHLASLLSSGGLLPQWPSATVTGDGSGARAIRILDLCTGTGCIPLLLASEVAGAAVTGGTAVHALGIDVSRKAVALARRNVLHNAAHLWPRDTAAAAARVDVGFLKADIFSPTFLPLVLRHLQDVDVLTANPPYISAAAYRSGTTARSVRRFEPALALVPSPTSALLVDFAERAGCRLDDVFYARLLDIFVSLCHSTASRPAKKTTRARVALFEVGDLDQAMRVSGMALRRVTAGTGLNADIEIWKDWPDCNDEDIDTVVVEGREIMIRGSGNGRSVLIRCSER